MAPMRIGVSHSTLRRDRNYGASVGVTVASEAPPIWRAEGRKVSDALYRADSLVLVLALEPYGIQAPDRRV